MNKLNKALIAIALLGSVGLSAKLMADKHLPKVAAGQCFMAKDGNEAYIIQSVADGRVKGIHILLMFGVALDKPVAEMNAMEGLAAIDCRTGQRL